METAPSQTFNIDFEIFLHIKLGIRVLKTTLILYIFLRTTKDTYAYTEMLSRKGKSSHLHKHQWTIINPLPAQPMWGK